MVETAGSSNPKAGPEGQITGVINAEAFRERLFAAREGKADHIGPLASSAAGKAAYASMPSAAHSMQYGMGSPELQQLQEINAGIKEVRCFVVCFEFLDVQYELGAAVGGTAAGAGCKAWQRALVASVTMLKSTSEPFPP
jgi:hypothetical protein